MKLTFCKEWLCFAVSDKLLQILAKAAEPLKEDQKETRSIIFNFRDPNYSAESGGFHPVELRIFNTKAGWKFDYITDFSFQGIGYMAELCKEIDFIFAENIAYHVYTGELSGYDASSLFELWQDNFISYVEMGVFQVEISLD